MFKCSKAESASALVFIALKKKGKKGNMEITAPQLGVAASGGNQLKSQISSVSCSHCCRLCFITA